MHIKQRALKAKMYIDGFYAGALRVMSACFLLNCFLFNAYGWVLHVGTIRNMPSVVAEAHAEEPSAYKMSECHQTNLKAFSVCRAGEIARQKEGQ